MPAFTPLPLGQPIPNRLHAVSVSIPTMRDLVRYEEKDPGTLEQMPSGYPRFIVHSLIQRLARHLCDRCGLADRKLWLVSSEKMAAGLQAHLGDPGALLFAHGDIWGLSHPQDPELSTRAKAYLQHTGGFLSSRRAEDELVRLGVLAAPCPEEVPVGDAGGLVWDHLAPYLPGAERQDSVITGTGINAVYSAFKALSSVQEKRGRSIWVQLGWLYLDTIAIMKKFTTTPGDRRLIRQVDDRAALERLVEEEGPRIAGIIAEVPTNPLIQTPDLPWLRELASRHGIGLILDPSVASIYAVDLLPYADILVTSLTKYTAHEGDVIAGLVVVNPKGRDAAALRQALPDFVEPIYSRDLARLAAQVETAAETVCKIEERLWNVAFYLESRPEVSAVHWSRASRTSAAFSRVARSPLSAGGMLSFELKVPLEAFYDALRLPKGPSFGMNSSLACPFIWMAHYDLVNTPEGRAELAASGINPDLLRLSIGTEPAEDIIAALEAAFRAARRKAPPNA